MLIFMKLEACNMMFNLNWRLTIQGHYLLFLRLHTMDHTPRNFIQIMSQIQTFQYNFYTVEFTDSINNK